VDALEDRCLLAGGVLNSAFGNGGIAGVPIADAVAVQSNGDIVCAGKTGPYGSEQITVSRVTPTGALDTTFNGSGSVNISAGNKATYGGPLLIQPDGKILVGGFAVVSKFNASDEEFVVARLKPDGSLDKSFGHGGLFTWNATAYRDDVRGLALLPNGDILVTGNTNGVYIGSQGDAYGLLRLTPGGSLDTTFGKSGLAVAAFNGPDGPSGSIVLAPNGDILLCGSDAGGHADLVAFTSQGALDTSYGGTGHIQYAAPVGYSGYSFSSMVLQGSNLVMAGSLSYVGSDGKNYTKGVVSRYSLAGVLDTSFGTSGSYIAVGGYFGPLVLEADGSIVVAGGGVVGHLSADGQPDTTFGSDGSGFVSNSALPGSSLALDGSYIVLGGGGTLAELTAS
jgi:uncharacterized delta-60 repeat protein